MKDGIFRKAGGILLVMTILCCVYMLAVTGLGQLLFSEKANGSLITVDGKTYGSQLLAQQFTDNGHLWGRVMYVDTTTFTDESGNAVMYAQPSNLTPASDAYETLIAQRVEALRAAHPDQDLKAVPVDLVTCSGSGLDPEISPAAAAYQVGRIAAATGRTEEDVQSIIDTYTTGRFLGIFGEPRVNVLQVNLALDGIL